MLQDTSFFLDLYMAHINDYMLPCLSKSMLGIECPGCGIQRASSLMIQGHFTDAFYMYPAIYTLILFFGVVVYTRFRSIKFQSKIIGGLAVINVILILTNYLLKFI